MAARSMLLAPSFPPTVGGIETLLYQTSRRLRRPPVVVAPLPACVPDLDVRPVATRPKGPAGRVAYRVSWAVHPSLHYLATFWRPAFAVARETLPDVIQCGHVSLAPLAWLLASRLGRPFVVYAYGQEVLREARSAGVRAVDDLLRGRALRHAAAGLAASRFTAGLLETWGVLPERIHLVPFGAEPRTWAGPPRGSTLLSVCRLVPRKGVDTVLRALPLVQRLVPDVQYRVVGAGPDEARLHALAARLGLAGRVAFLGRLDDAALAQELQRCALFVLPARREGGELEGLGLVYLEAAAWGRPAVAGRSGGEVDAVVDGLTGRVVDGTSVEAVADAIVGLLSRPPVLERLGEAARARVERTHNWDRAAAVVDGVLERVTRTRTATRIASRVP